MLSLRRFATAFSMAFITLAAPCTAAAQTESQLPNRAGSTLPPAPLTPSVTAPVPNWTGAQWDALYTAALHTAGATSYEYQVLNYLELPLAQRASNIGMARPPTLKARNLLDVSPPLRMALALMYQAGERSAPIPRTLSDGRKAWAVLQLVSRGTALPLRPDGAFQSDAATWVARGQLAQPDELLNSPEERSRIAFLRARSAAEVAAVPAHLSPDVMFGDGSSPLLNAILRKDLDAAMALVRRGADVNRCGVWGCPLSLAARMDEEAQSLAWVDWLISRGAKAEMADPQPGGIFPSALDSAAYRGYQRVGQRLLDAGAAVGGIADARTTPVESAAVHGRRPMVEWLIAKGAPMLPRPNTQRPWLGPYTLYRAASETNDAAFMAWAEQTMLKAAAADPGYRVSMVFEQDGRRVEAGAQGIVRLRAAPFRIVFQLPQGSEGVQVGASTQAAWLDEFRKGDRRNAMFRPLASGALTQASEPGSRYMLTMRPCPAAVKPDDGCDGTHMFLNTDLTAREDFHERRAGGLYVRDVQTVVETSGANPVETAVEKFAGQTLYIVAGNPVAIGGPSGLRFTQPLIATVQFAR